MLNIGEKITELRKKEKWSQNDLAKAINASRDIIGKYERNDNLPSIEMALKMARVFNVSVDFLLGEGQYGSYSKEMVNRLDQLETLPSNEKERVFEYIDLIIRDFKTKKAYAS